MRSPQTAGEEWPTGIDRFQSRCVDGPNSIGGAAPAAAIPLALGPRNCGHAVLWAAAKEGKTATATSSACTARLYRRMDAWSSAGLLTTMFDNALFLSQIAVIIGFSRLVAWVFG